MLKYLLVDNENAPIFVAYDQYALIVFTGGVKNI